MTANQNRTQGGAGAMGSIDIPVSQASLFLDLDGTLAPIAATPTEVGPDPERSALLRRAADALDGRLAIISGRTLEEVDRIVEACLSCVAGVHGLQRRNSVGQVSSAEPHPALEAAEAAFTAAARTRGGLLVEPKILSLALHYRAEPEAAGAVRELAGRLARNTGLELQEGDMVVELKTPGADKGDAVTAFMAEAPFRHSTPIFMGDDLTDEAGFKAVAELGGVGVLVGPPRRTQAAVRLRDPAEALAWIADSLEAGRFVLEARR